MKRVLALLPVLMLLLAGCENRPRYSIEEQPPGPPAVVHPNHPVQSNAGTAGPLAPDKIGLYMDGQERDLRQHLRGVQVARVGDTITLILHSDTLFEKGGGLADGGDDLLKAVADVLRHYDHTLIQVNGYTDTTGSPDSNLKVSQRRADAVAAALRAGGVDTHRIAANGFGITHLKIATGPDKPEPRNRRVEIRILPHPG